ncbi:hypothetical protein NDU88_000884 [Pleurodeles waltl]|uniref:Uncharacterized protein n=1 Tax=Pleurodeles waltl TaxID=8319 RepID=A0AAV7P5F2_PLEWA|nr:hypothetical protein NDU88_000884 [Pleurodeles waltl]
MLQPAYGWPGPDWGPALSDGGMREPGEWAEDWPGVGSEELWFAGAWPGAWSEAFEFRGAGLVEGSLLGVPGSPESGSACWVMVHGYAS